MKSIRVAEAEVAKTLPLVVYANMERSWYGASVYPQWPLLQHAGVERPHLRIGLTPNLMGPCFRFDLPGNTFRQPVLNWVGAKAAASRFERTIQHLMLHGVLS